MLEPAQLVWQGTLELVEPVDPADHHDRFAAVLEVLRLAAHDPTTLAHALAIGRTHLHKNEHSADIRRGTRTLAAAVAFLGVKPQLN
jgi:hypothetical protein